MHSFAHAKPMSECENILPSARLRVFRRALCLILLLGIMAGISFPQSKSSAASLADLTIGSLRNPNRKCNQWKGDGLIELDLPQLHSLTTHRRESLANISNISFQQESVVRVRRGFGESEFTSYYTTPLDVVMWYSATGHDLEDVFFLHGAFFGVGQPGQKKPLNAASSITGSFDPQNPAQDGPSNITLGQVFKDGESSVKDVNPSLAPTLPANYVLYGSKMFSIGTSASFSGPNVLEFSVPSTSDKSLFSTLRILHLEPDELDPSKGVWRDRTIYSPDPKGPDFTNRIISARTSTLGVFAIVRKTASDPTFGNADLSLTVTQTSDRVVQGNRITTTVNVANLGPQDATDVVLINKLPSQMRFVSFSSQIADTNCLSRENVVQCKLGTIANGASKSVDVLIETLKDGEAPTAAGLELRDSVMVTANETDENPGDNWIISSVWLLPSGKRR
jgi:uncharacterized repeat protein (TIGR01451 family)